MKRFRNARRLGYNMIKDSGLTKRVDDETSLYPAVKVSFRVHLKKY